MSVYEAHEFINAFSAMSEHVHSMAIQKGWWDRQQWAENCKAHLPNLYHDLIDQATSRNDAELIMLVVTELAEAVEGLREGNPPSEKIGDAGFSQVEEELADAIIRIMDLAEARNWRVAEAVVAKSVYNSGRSHRHGGKKF